MKKQYIAPDLTAVVFRAERGYAASGLIDNVAYKINEEAERVTAWGDLDNGVQDISGYNTDGSPETGMAAGYFREEQTDNWF